jgi:hypothetical protein
MLAGQLSLECSQNKKMDMYVLLTPRNDIFQNSNEGLIEIKRLPNDRHASLFVTN